MNYPLFLPPEHLALTTHRNWNREEAREYKTWLLNNIDERVSFLCDFASISMDEQPTKTLTTLGEVMLTTLPLPDFSYYEESEPNETFRHKLTSRGYALTADAGLLVATYLLRDIPSLQWQTVRAPKSDLSYSLPVLSFSNNYLEPIGGSIAEAFRILRGYDKGDKWKEIYTYWLQQEKSLD